jgi:Gpi18-like mannosyltransferase
MRTVKKILPQFISWRVLTLLPIFLGVFLLSYRSGYGYTNIFDTEALTFSKAIYSLANFDGVRYLAIALRGYVTEGAFFPLFPLIIKLLSFWSSNVTVLFWVGLLFSNLCFLAALVFLYKLLRLDYSKKISEETIFLILVFPVVFFYGAVYSESLFLLLLVLTFYFVRQKAGDLPALRPFY